MQFHNSLLLGILARLASTQSLQNVLISNGFTDFADQLQAVIPGNNSLSGSNLIIFAPPNGVITIPSSSSSTPTISTSSSAPAVGTSSSSTSSSSPTGGSVPYSDIVKYQIAQNNAPNLRRQVAGSSGSAFETLFNDPQYVNLGGSTGQGVVQTGSTVRSGLGNDVGIIGTDIPFEGGVIRPVDRTFTVPNSVSDTVSFLGLTKFNNLVQSAGLQATVDGSTRITVLAPNDAALASVTASGDAAAQLVKEHILVNARGYTPLLKDGAVFTTLAGTTATVSVQGGVIYVNGARIIIENLMTKNGVVHVVDSVMNQTTTGSTGTTTGSTGTAAGSTGTAAGSTGTAAGSTGTTTGSPTKTTATAVATTPPTVVSLAVSTTGQPLMLGILASTLVGIVIANFWPL